MTEVPEELQELDAPSAVTNVLTVQKQRPTLGPVRVDVAAFAGTTVLLVFAYLAWVAAIVAPPEIIAGTSAWFATVAGFFFPNDK